MGDLLNDFQEAIRGIEGTVRDALNGFMYRGLLEELQKAARQKVYDYPAKPYFKAKRRMMIADEENVASKDVDGTTLTVKFDTHLQIGEAGEIGIVEEGLRGWGQPYPRPFMETGLEEYAWGRADGDLAFALQQAGYDAHVG